MFNKKHWLIPVLMFLFFSSTYSQESVLQMIPYNGDTLSYVNWQIIADTTATGGLLPNRVYEFARDGIYLQNRTLTLPSGQTLRLRAADGSGKKPIIYLWESGTGATPTRPPGNFVVLNGANLEMKNICIAGYYEPEPDRIDGVQGGLINTTAVGNSIVLDGVVLSNINGQHVRVGNNSNKVQITNSIFANMGALTTSNLGAGKGLDLREAAIDTFIVENTTFVNYQDRAIRHYNFSNPQAGTGNLGYCKVNHNTFVNGMGFHGLLSLGDLGSKAIITDNLFVDGFALGEDSTDGTRTFEWANTGEIYPNGNNRITWIFSHPNDTTQWTVKNNYYTISSAGQAWLNDNHFGFGPFGEASQLTWHINSRLGADSVNAFKKENGLTLNNIPSLMTNMMTWYEDPAGGMRQKVQTNFVKERDDYDRRLIQYYRDSLNASYSTSALAYTGAQGGFPTGDLNWFPSKKAEWEIWLANQQESVLQMIPYNGDTLSYVNWQIIADTTATGGLLPNRVYEFPRDGIYLQNRTLTLPSGQTLRLRAADGSGKKPIIYLWESGTGATPTRPPGNFVVLNGANLEMKNICVAGYYEPEPDRVDGVQGGLINTTAAGSSIILDGVVFSNINGQHVRTGFNAVKVQITNSIFANMGALTTSNLGAGKGLDLREAAIDTFIVENTTFVNYQDRAIRHYNFSNPQAGTGNLGYCKVNHNTFVNGMGFHGLLSLGDLGSKAIITDNLFVDGFALGEDSTDGTRTFEWANTGEIYPNGNNRITWIFSHPNDTTQWTVKNNYYTISSAGQAWLNDNHFGFGPFGEASQLTWHINSRLGADSVNAFKKENGLTLNNIPSLMTNMMTWYEDPAGGMRQKVQTNFVKERDDYDRRLIQYYRDSLNASYSTSALAYTGAQGGFPTGDLNWFPSKKAEWEIWVLTDVNDEYSNVPISFKLNQNYPNPFNPSTKISFSLENAGKTTLTIYNILGQKVATILSQELSAGHHEINFDASNLSSGVYLYKLDSSHFTAVKKMMILK